MRHRASSLVVIAFSLLAFGVTAPVALADPIVITSGSFGQHTSDPTFFTFIGDGFVLRGGSGQLGPELADQLPFFTTCCHPGQPVDLDGHVTGQTIIQGHDSTFNGVTYNQLFWSGHLDFDSAPAVWPTNAGAPGVGPVTAPFQMTGQLTAFSDPNFSTPPLFSVDLIGSGTTTLGVLPFNAPGDLDFTFSAEATAAPEPASLLLMGLGLGGMALRNRARRR